MKRKLALFAGGAMLAIAPWAAGQSLVINRIVQTGDPVPGVGGTYTQLGLPTAYYGNWELGTATEGVDFEGQSSNGNSGIYQYSMNTGTGQTGFSTAIFADTSMAAPTGGKYASFSNVSSEALGAAFTATDTNGVVGLYTCWFPGQTYLVATTGASPSPGVTFGNFYSFSAQGAGGGVLFTSDAGIYVAEPEVPSLNSFLVANTSTTPPGASGPFTSFGGVSHKGLGIIGTSNVYGYKAPMDAFRATAGGAEAIYYSPPFPGSGASGLQDIADTAHPSIVDFTSFGDPIVTFNQLGFTAHYRTDDGDQQGIFEYGFYADGPDFDSPTLFQVAATGQTAPGTGGATFTSFSDLADDGVDQTFLANLSNGGEGLFYRSGYFGGSLEPFILNVLETGEMLDGKVVNGIALAPESSAGSETVFEVNFTDGSEGLYYFTASLPEPGELALFGVAAIGVVRWRKRDDSRAAHSPGFAASGLAAVRGDGLLQLIDDSHGGGVST